MKNAIEMKQTQVHISNPVYLELSKIELSKIVIYEFLYDYVKLKFGEKAKMCHMVSLYS